MEIQNVEIQKIYRSKQNKDGKPYLTKKGQPFEKVDIYIDPRLLDHPEFEGKLTYFDFFENSTNWDIGTTISGAIETNEMGGKTYFNFQLPVGGKKALELDIKELTERIKRLEEVVFPKPKRELTFDKPKAMAPEVEGPDEMDDELPF
jgi:hypothetical protein